MCECKLRNLTELYQFFVQFYQPVVRSLWEDTQINYTQIIQVKQSIYQIINNFVFLNLKNIVFIVFLSNCKSQSFSLMLFINRSVKLSESLHSVLLICCLNHCLHLFQSENIFKRHTMAPYSDNIVGIVYLLNPPWQNGKV